MRILLVCHSFNSLAQRLHVALREAGHEVSVELDVNDAVTREAVALYRPDLVIAPFLKRAIASDVWRSVRCLIVHPGVRGDKGPSALDWAILEGEQRWGVTLIEARDEMDGGPVWAWREFPMRAATKASLYRHEVAEAALECVFEALARLQVGETTAPTPVNRGKGRARRACGADERRIDFARHGVEDALRITRASDGAPGALISLFGRDWRAYDASRAPGLVGAPGAALARSRVAVAVGLSDGALWIGQAKRPGAHEIKLPAAQAMAAHLDGLAFAESPSPLRYEEDDGVGFLSFDFYNGAFATADCEALSAELDRVLARGLRVLVLLGGKDCWSNGMHLGVIEASESPAEESWRNINAMNDLVERIARADGLLVISAMRGNAGAGGVFISLAADEVWMGANVILNPHYKDMGNLYGSEYWTYLLPKRVGEARARQIAQARLPMGVEEAMRLGLANARLPADAVRADEAIRAQARALAANTANLTRRIEAKRRRRAEDEAAKPLAAYREEELARMKRNFYGFDPSYHVARYNFIRKIAKSRTPLTLAVHRSSAFRAPTEPVASLP
ncbi:MAG: enoyl-CoA hydratase-related protein [Roseiarcus sp.]|jgi:putative two-component system hydrogenase maturation factor HypX/HoxX